MANKILATAFMVFVVATTFIKFTDKDDIPMFVVGMASILWFVSLITCLITLLYLIWA